MRRKRKRKIFVSYQWMKKDNLGVGNTFQFSTLKGYISQQDIRDIEQFIKEEQGFTSVVILDYKFV